MKKAIKIGFPIICVVIVLGTLIAISNLKNKVKDIQTTNTLSSSSNYQNYSNNNYINRNLLENTVENKITNTVINEKNTSVQNTVIENKIINNTSVKVNTTKTEESTQDIDNTSDKDKAIAMAKKEWGEDSSVYFTNEGLSSSGYYIVAVRDKSNTSAKLFYKIDLNNNTIEIDW